MKKGYMLVLGTAVISGVSIFLNKFAVSGLNPYLFAGAKNLLVAVFLLSLLFLFKEFKDIKNITSRQWGLLAAIGLLGGSVPFLLFFKGLSMAPSVTASLLHKSMFIFITIGAVFFLREKLSKTIIVAALLLFAGNLVLTGKSALGFGVPELLILTAVLFWSAEAILSKYVLKELSSRMVAFGRMFFGALFILVFLAATGNINNIVSLTASQLGWIVLTSVLLLGYVTSWYAGLKLVPASSAACVLVVGSAVTTVLSLVFSGSVVLTDIISSMLILSGVIVLVGYSYIASKVRMFFPFKN